MTNKVIKIQNDFTSIARVVTTGEDQGIVEDVTYGFSAPTNVENP